MKKVGIITWHYIKNYGSSLQAYALQKTIAHLGYKAEIIDYRKSGKFVYVRKFLRKFPFLLNGIKLFIYNKRIRNFNIFDNHFLKLTPLYTSQIELEKSKMTFDIYVSGSDQIWSPNLLDPVYLLNFVKSNKKKISYAPSVVIDDFTEEQKEILNTYIKEFDFVSVREQKGAKIIKKITGRDAEVVLDPTFLLTAKEWDRISVVPKIKKKYILCYFLGDNTEHRNIVLELQKQCGYDIVMLPFLEKDYEFGNIIDADAGPRKFLGFIKNAEYVCTDSFHGVAFSIIYAKNFYAFYRFSENIAISQNARVDHILQTLDLKDRIVKNIEDIHKTKEIDYNRVFDLMKKERMLSLEFLSSSLKSSMGGR